MFLRHLHGAEELLQPADRYLADWDVRAKGGPQISCAVTALSEVPVANDPKGGLWLHPVNAEIATVLGLDYSIPVS